MAETTTGPVVADGALADETRLMAGFSFKIGGFDFIAAKAVCT
jgi:hypothetical protein